MTINIKNFILLFLLFTILAGTTHIVHRQIRGKLGEEPPMDILYLPRGQYVKVISLGFNNFLADLLWIRSLQYFGGHFMYDRKYPIIDRILEVIISLEPTFVDVYSFGAMVLHEEIGERDKAVVLLNKGIENNPDYWRLPYELGFLWFQEMMGAKDTTYRKEAASKAMEAYAIATSRSNCPDFVTRIVWQMQYESGHEDLAVFLWTQQLKEAEKTGNTLVAQIMQDKLDLHKFKKVVEPIRNAIYQYYKKYEKIPQNLDVLVKEGLITRIPLDPITHSPLEYDSRIGRVYSKLKPQF